MANVCSICHQTKIVSFATIREKDEAELLKVEIKFNGKPCCGNEIDEYLQKVQKIYLQKRKCQILYDATHIGIITNKTYLGKLIGFMRSFDEDTKKYVDRAAIVVCDKTVRSILKGIFLVKPPSCPLQIVTSVQRAKVFLATS